MNRDNHAGKIETLSYIAGFFDGEGYIGLGLQHTHKGACKNILPSVRISNTDSRPLKIIQEEMTRLGIKCWFSQREGKRRVQRTTKGGFVKTIYDIGISGKEQVRNFIKHIRPYVLCKGEQMDVVMEFILSRDPKMANRGNRQGIGKAEYSAEEMAMIDRIKALKQKSF